MMDTSLLLIVLVVVSGRLLIAGLPHTCYKTPHWPGYHLFVVSFVVGFLLLPFALALHDGLSRIFSLLPQFSSSERPVQDISSAEYVDYAGFLSIALVSFVLAWLIPKVYEWAVNDKDGSVRVRHIKEAATARGNLMEVMFIEAMEQGEEGARPGVEILMESGTVYTGIVVESSIARARANAVVKLLLVHSGYWDKNARKFVTVENHAGSEPEDYPLVVIPVRNIVSVCKGHLS